MISLLRRFLIPAAFLCLLLLTVLDSCSLKSRKIAIIWTNQPEFASYVELFNNSQDRHRIVVEYKENPSGALMATKDPPEIIIGPWLKGEKTRSRLVPIDYLFAELRINSKQFYSALLDLGNVRGRQYLLPVSFNLPAIIFSADNKGLIENDFSLSLEQIQDLSRDYNEKTGGIYTKMGFSPRWDSEFLYLVAQMFNARFEEGSSLFGWNEASLAEGIRYLRAWTTGNNTSPRAEDDFQFKYLYDPPHKLVAAGRNLFSYMSSEQLLVLPRDKIQNIDFRWVMKDNKTPVRDDIVYLGICKRARNMEAAEAFIIWFYGEKNQRALLDRAKQMGIMDQNFGISGGFSALKPVNEKVYPLFYPSLLGHLPPEETLGVPRILPNNWETIKTSIVIPYLVSITGAPAGMEDSVPTLQERISIWQKTH